MQAPEAVAEEPSTKQKAAASLLQAAKDGSLEKSLQDFEQKAATPEAKLWHGQGFHDTPYTDTEAEAEHDATLVQELAEMRKSSLSPVVVLVVIFWDTLHVVCLVHLACDLVNRPQRKWRKQRTFHQPQWRQQKQRQLRHVTFTPVVRCISRSCWEAASAPETAAPAKEEATAEAFGTGIKYSYVQTPQDYGCTGLPVHLASHC